MQHGTVVDAVRIPDGADFLDGDLYIPEDAHGLVIFAHGSGSSRFSSRNRQVADSLNRGEFATLLLDLLTPHEERIDVRTAEYRFDIPLLGRRVIAASDWATAHAVLRELPVGYFGASTGAAAALAAAARLPDLVAAVVSRGGRPDLIPPPTLAQVRAPVLLVVGSQDPVVLRLNRSVLPHLRTAELTVVPGATHLFEEPGTLDSVAQLAARWFERCFVSTAALGPRSSV